MNEIHTIFLTLIWQKMPLSKVGGLYPSPSCELAVQN